jgi:NADH pyrophosphatase NudC (nudix superfamily)
MFNYCPSCGDKGIDFDGKNRFSCAACGFVYYHNTAAAVGLVIETAAGLLLLERARDPAKGKLDLPGGFVDPRESVVEGLRRECREELGWDCGEGIAFLTSFPNVYPYKGVVYNTCDMFFTLRAPELRAGDLTLEKDEVSSCRFVKPRELNLEDIAFDSMRRALALFKAG